MSDTSQRCRTGSLLRPEHGRAERFRILLFLVKLQSLKNRLIFSVRADTFGNRDILRPSVSADHSVCCLLWLLGGFLIGGGPRRGGVSTICMWRGARAGDSPSGDPQREMIKPDRLFVCLSACDHVHTCRIIQPARILLREEKDHVTQVLTGLNQSEAKKKQNNQTIQRL